MRRSKLDQTGYSVFLFILTVLGCGQANPPVALTSLDLSQDQRNIAAYYSHEAALLRQKADEVAHRVEAYEQLFGPDSEWAIGTRPLVQFYNDAARERERLAEVHLDLIGSQKTNQRDGKVPALSTTR